MAPVVIRFLPRHNSSGNSVRAATQKKKKKKIRFLLLSCHACLFVVVNLYIFLSMKCIRMNGWMDGVSPFGLDGVGLDNWRKLGLLIPVAYISRYDVVCPLPSLHPLRREHLFQHDIPPQKKYKEGENTATNTNSDTKSNFLPLIALLFRWRRRRHYWWWVIGRAR